MTAEQPDNGWEPGTLPIYGHVGPGTKPASFGTWPSSEGWSEFMVIDGREYGSGELHRIPVEAPLTQAIMAELRERRNVEAPGVWTSLPRSLSVISRVGGPWPSWS
jgi:hypothetical protein